MPRIKKTEDLSEHEKEILRELWNSVYPARLSWTSAEHFGEYLSGLCRPLHYLWLHDDRICGWAFTFDREHEKWFGLLIARSHQHAGQGARILKLLQEDHKDLSGWVIDHSHELTSSGLRYWSPLSFYLKNGFNVFPAERHPVIRAVKIKWTRNSEIVVVPESSAKREVDERRFQRK